MNKKHGYLIFGAASMILAGCTGCTPGGEGPSVVLRDFENVTMSDLEVYYDGATHTIAPVGAPEGATITYNGEHEFSSVGEHTIKVTISMEGYNSLELEAKLTIKALLTFSGVTMTDAEFYYDGASHTVEPVGVPEGATVTYEGEHEFSAIGEHTVVAKINKEHYEELVLSAKVTIKALEVFEGITLSDSEVYYDGQSHTIVPTGVPAGATCDYVGEHEFTEIGEHTITIKVTQEHYEDLTLSAKLTIKALETFTGVTLNDSTVDYDGQSHTIAPVGLPSGANWEYTGDHEFTLPGEYTITGKVTQANYEDLTLSAKLTIVVPTATQKLVVDDFEGIGDSDLASDWKLEYYNNAIRRN